MKVLIVDDEPLAVQRLQKMLDECEGYRCVGTAANGIEALAKIEQLQPDITLSDIRMPDMDGIALATAVKANSLYRTVLVFTTAYEDHAMQAFDLDASGYLLKPVSKDKLSQALQRAAKLVDNSKKVETRHYLTATARGKIELIPLANVRLLQADHKYVSVYHTQGEALINDSLKMLEEEFPQLFKRVHRNALVSVQHVEALRKESDGNYYLKLQGIAATPQISRRLLSDVRQWLKQL